MSLTQKSCIPCRQTVAPMSAAEAQAMLQNVAGWALVKDGAAISKRWAFKNFAQALAFVNQVGEVAEAEDHHPDIAFGWGYVSIELMTHNIQGLHENDFILAAKIDAIAGQK